MQYMPQKPTKWSIKAFTLLSSLVYTGGQTLENADPTYQSLPQPVHVVMDVMYPYLNKGYHLFTDRYEQVTAKCVYVCYCTVHTYTHGCTNTHTHTHNSLTQTTYTTYTLYNTITQHMYERTNRPHMYTKHMHSPHHTHTCTPVWEINWWPMWPPILNIFGCH